MELHGTAVFTMSHVKPCPPKRIFMPAHRWWKIIITLGCKCHSSGGVLLHGRGCESRWNGREMALCLDRVCHLCSPLLGLHVHGHIALSVFFFFKELEDFLKALHTPKTVFSCVSWRDPRVLRKKVAFLRLVRLIRCNVSYWRNKASTRVMETNRNNLGVPQACMVLLTLTLSQISSLFKPLLSHPLGGSVFKSVCLLHSYWSQVKGPF